MSSDEIEKQELSLPRVDQMPKRPPDKALWDDITVELFASAANVTYAGCGSHELQITINIKRDRLIEFLDKYNNERLEVSDAGNGS